MRIKSIRGLVCFVVLSSLALSACSLVPVKTPASDLTATAVALIPTVEPATPTTPPPLAVLVTPDGFDPIFAEQLDQKIRSLAEGAGMRFQVRPVLNPGDLSSDMTVVTVMAPDPGIARLAQAAPQTQFIGVGIGGVAAGQNLNLIHAQLFDTQDLAFIAGYTAGVITPDWRAGILLPADQANAVLLYQAYSNGLHYWCGLCQPAYAPFVVYPQSAQILNPSDPVATFATVDTLTNVGVTTIYIPAEVATTPLLEYAAQKNVLMLGEDEPSESFASLWVVSLQAGDLLGPFESVWQEVLAGNGGRDVEVPLQLAHTGAGLLGEARQRVVNEMLIEFSKGLIDPGLVPDY